MIKQEIAPPPVSQPFHRVVVDEVECLSPHVRRIAFEGPSLAGMRVDLPAQWLQLALPEELGGPLMDRAYTIRGFYRGWRVLVIDVVLHSEAGPVSRWAQSAKVGDIAYLGLPRGGYRVDPLADWRLLAGDETALPAIASILEALPEDGIQTCVVLEVPTVDDIQALGYPDGTEIHWLARNRGPVRDSEQLRETVASLHLPAGSGQVFVAGETETIRGIHQELLHRVPSACIDAKGYWLRGRAGHRERL
ncbi:siderophore-interacting protein [Frateuria aurantia]